MVRVETSGRLYRFAGALEGLLAAPDAEAFERAWETAHVDRLAWEALGGARRAHSGALEPALDQVDRRLLAMLERCRAFPDPHVATNAVGIPATPRSTLKPSFSRIAVRYFEVSNSCIPNSPKLKTLSTMTCACFFMPSIWPPKSAFIEASFSAVTLF